MSGKGGPGRETSTYKSMEVREEAFTHQLTNFHYTWLGTRDTEVTDVVTCSYCGTCGLCNKTMEGETRFLK